MFESVQQSIFDDDRIESRWFYFILSFLILDSYDLLEKCSHLYSFVSIRFLQELFSLSCLFLSVSMDAIIISYKPIEKRLTSDCIIDTFEFFTQNHELLHS